MISTFFTISEQDFKSTEKKETYVKPFFERLEEKRYLSGTVYGAKPVELMSLVKKTAIDKFGSEKIEYKETISNEGLNEFYIKIKG